MRDSAFINVAPIGSTRKKIIIPYFSLASTWGGVSAMLARYAIGNLNPFTVKRPIVQPNETFIAAISWAEDPYVYRYKVTENIGEVLYFPVYVQERIGANAYIEIWSVASEPLAAIGANWELRVSNLVLPTLCEPCQENEESQILVQAYPQTLPPAQHCNPFCSPLCT